MSRRRTQGRVTRRNRAPYNRETANYSESRYDRKQRELKERNERWAAMSNLEKLNSLDCRGEQAYRQRSKILSDMSRAEMISYLQLMKDVKNPVVREFVYNVVVTLDSNDAENNHDVVIGNLVIDEMEAKRKANEAFLNELRKEVYSE
jgi:hypothetical protein